ncbi:hypothetical protein [Trichodesmium erythraeum]|uniref:hypothetical protein n=1 Tax=Trichodesmium erythraeum TaxID=1206 RepID=UPI0005C4A0BD|nr:hypothetical protein [Trichodesmium erythraeum GBRTRLIN201]MDE5094543.1 hypothetical protein [Trichodesmium sp. St11_bin5]MDT9339039.1 hypothetical protein [Trichodesmium erythraeum 21-75]
MPNGKEYPRYIILGGYIWPITQIKDKLSHYYLGTEKKVSLRPMARRKLSILRKNQEKQERTESKEKKKLETGGKQFQ